MSFVLVVLSVFLATPSKQPLPHIRHTLSSTFENSGNQTPQVDSALELASQQLAEEVLHLGIEQTSAFQNVLQATSRSGALDAMPRAYFFLGDCVEHLLKAATQALSNPNAQQTTTHMGIGLASKGPQHALCVLLVERKGWLLLPKMDWEKPWLNKKKIPVCVELYGMRTKPRLVVQTPQNQIQETTMQAENRKWCAVLTFPSAGQYTVEVIAQTNRGPQVTHLFLVHAGKSSSSSSKTNIQNKTAPKDKTLAQEALGFEKKRQQIYDAINQLRQESALGRLRVKKELEKLAQQYAQRMKEEAFFSHVDSQGSGLRERLQKAKIVCQEAGENLGMGDSPWVAHHAIEQSPAHRAALLNKRFQHMGIGFMSGPDGKTYLVEVFCN